jgi:hypothetical protein
LWIAGTLNKRNRDRIVRFGDAWIPIMGESVEGIAAGVREIHAARDAAGRDSSRFDVQGPIRVARDEDGQPDLARSMESVPELLAAGVTNVQVALAAFCRDPAQAPAVFTDLVARFAAAI